MDKNKETTLPSLTRSGLINRYTELISRCYEIAERLDDKHAEEKEYFSIVAVNVSEFLQKELKKEKNE